MTALTLLFGAAGVAQATDTVALVPAATSTTLAAETETEDDGGDNGLWGLAGLLGLIGLAGLKRRGDTRDVAPGNRGTNPVVQLVERDAAPARASSALVGAVSSGL